ncbi:MAG: peptidoglycan-binding protein, partial [Rhizobiaceae bacterium]|nr:peptidoglycan-binding protein [Rhizobiaceae bacterium]
NMLPATIAAGAYLPARVKKELDWPLPIANGAKGMPAKRVQEWLTLHGFAVVIDGQFGAATEKRLRDFQTANGIAATGVVDARTHERLVAPLVKALTPIASGSHGLPALIAAYGRQHVAQHPMEAGGDNRGPWVRAYLNADGPEWRWCAGFTCFALEQASRTLGKTAPIASSASCDVLAMQAKQKGLYVPAIAVASGSVPKSRLVPGTFFLIRKTSNDWTHVGIVTHADATTFDTLEGNTNDDGSANGFEAVARTRNYAGKDFIVW